MKEVKGNIWDFYNQGHWIVITTNGTVKANGEAVMGRGVALQARIRFPRLPRWLGMHLASKGNQLFVNHLFKVITFPVKDSWQGKAKLPLIISSCEELVEACKNTNEPVYMVRPGCGNGGLDWKDVKPILERYLDDRFVVVNFEEKE